MMFILKETRKKSNQEEVRAGKICPELMLRLAF
jgi:hypothetical protein